MLWIAVKHIVVGLCEKSSPPCLFMQATTVELSVATNTVWF